MLGFRIVLKPEAVKDMDGLRKYEATIIADAMQTHLREAPDRTAGRRVKRLRGRQKADFRLRAGAYRVFYSVEGRTVHVLRVLHKAQTREFYEEER